ncbi:hypothetical protein D9613_011735 [Agrocybe pediades]|uniref:Uncharacterized protein n=1 Tax=Agrocybe pediades TaxID=84607 RepID=A0A8H4VK01_9AGAR|nr:hypothetical protein D9613_011735 [Agrocybe pediades]
MARHHLATGENVFSACYLHRYRQKYLSSPAIHPLLEILAHPNPALESMIVDIHVPSEHSDVDQGYDPPAFPTTGPPLTNLKYMELRNAPFYLLTSRCTSLTHFHLHDLHMTERPTLRYFLFMLEQLGNLQDLILHRAFPIIVDAGDSKPQVGPISLPRLQTISLIGSVPEITNVLECIILPPSARLLGKIYTLSDFKSTVWKLTNPLSVHSWGAEGGGLPLEMLVLTGDQSCGRFVNGLECNPDFRQSLRIRGFRADCGDRGPLIDLTIAPEEYDPCDDGLIIALCAIWKALSLTQVHTSALKDLDVITQKTWTQFLRTLPSLRILDITGKAPSGLVWTMLLNARSHAQGQKRLKKAGGEISEGRRILIPRLNDMYLHNVDCASGGFMVAPNAPVNSHCDLDDSRFLDVFLASLVARRSFDVCLGSLSIARCEHVLRQNVDDARAAVKYLVCNFRHVVKDEEVDADCPASYWGGCDVSSIPGLWHYHRLRALVKINSGPN